MIKKNGNYKITKYSEDRSETIGKCNLEALKRAQGQLCFTGVYIHLSPICNMKCEGCFTHTHNLDKKNLGFSTIKSVVDFAKENGATSIIFAGAGEPTLEPEFDKITKYIKKQGLQIVLFSNLTSIENMEMAKEHLENGPVVGKLFTLDKHKYNSITNCSQAYDLTIRGLDFLKQARKELEQEGKDVNLAIDSYITKENYMDLPDLLRFCRKNNLIPYFEVFIELGQSVEVIDKLALSQKELEDLFRELKKIDKEEFNIETTISPYSRNYGQDPCKKATHMFSVRENGDVHMCICSLRKVGNVYRDGDPYKSLQSIFSLNNQKLKDFFVCDKCSKQVMNK